MKIKYKDIIQIIIISLALSLFRYFFLDDYPLIKKTNIKEVADFSSESDSLLMFINNLKSPTLVDLKTAKLLYDKNFVTFIDARDNESFSKKHILTSVNLPYELIEQIIIDYDLEYMFQLKEDFTQKIDLNGYVFYIGMSKGDFYLSRSMNKINNESFANKNFIIYCSGHGCSLSEDLGFYLYNLGIKKILIYEGGMPEWLDNGFPVNND